MAITDVSEATSTLGVWGGPPCSSEAQLIAVRPWFCLCSFYPQDTVPCPSFPAVLWPNYNSHARSITPERNTPSKLLGLASPSGNCGLILDTTRAWSLRLIRLKVRETQKCPDIKGNGKQDNSYWETWPRGGGSHI